MKEFKPLYTRLVLDRHKLSVHANDPKLSERARFTAAHMCTVLTDTACTPYHRFIRPLRSNQ